MLEPGPLSPTHTKTKPAMLSNQAYDIVKWVATVGLPGIGTLYFALAAIWEFPAAEQVVGTIAALNVFFGILLQISSKTFNQTDVAAVGEYEVEYQPDGKKVYSLSLNEDPKNLKDNQVLTFQVKNK